MSQWNAWIQNHQNEIDEELNAVKRVERYDKEESRLIVNYKVKPHDSLANSIATLEIDGIENARLNDLIRRIEGYMKDLDIFTLDPIELLRIVNDVGYEIDSYDIHVDECETKLSLQAF